MRIFLIFLLLVSSPSQAACLADDYICHFVSVIDFTDSRYAALLAASALAFLGVVLLGLTIGVNWLQGKTHKTISLDEPEFHKEDKYD